MRRKTREKEKEKEEEAVGYITVPIKEQWVLLLTNVAVRDVLMILR